MLPLAEISKICFCGSVRPTSSCFQRLRQLSATPLPANRSWKSSFLFAPRMPKRLAAGEHWPAAPGPSRLLSACCDRNLHSSERAPRWRPRRARLRLHSPWFAAPAAACSAQRSTTGRDVMSCLERAGRIASKLVFTALEAKGSSDIALGSIGRRKECSGE